MTKNQSIEQQLYEWALSWNLTYLPRQPLMAELKQLKTRNPTINFKRVLTQMGCYNKLMDSAIIYIGERV